MVFVKRLGIVLTLMSLSIVLSSCASMAAGLTKGVLDKAFEDDPPVVEATITTASDLNPDASGKATPVVFRFYELKAIGSFNAADFFSLYDQDAEILGPDMLAREEWTLVPGETREMTRELNIETRYFGVVAAYRDLDNSVWRASIETPIDETIEVIISIDRLSVKISHKK